MARIENTPWHKSRCCRQHLALTAGIVSIMILQAGFAAGVYRWVDEHGNVHYGDRPPSNEETTRLEFESAPTPAPEEDQRRMKTQRLLDALKSERERERQEAAQARAEKARQERNCQSARRQVAMYQRANSISRPGPDGERIYLSDEERSLALARARILVGQWCK